MKTQPKEKTAKEKFDEEMQAIGEQQGVRLPKKKEDPTIGEKVGSKK